VARVTDRAAAGRPPLLPRLAAGVGSLAGWRRVLLAAVCGGLAAAALPPFYALPLLIPSFTLALWQLQGATGHRQALITGWAFGFGYFAAGIYWVGIAFLVDVERFGWVMPFAVSGLAAGLALFPALAFWLTHAASRRFALGGVAQVLALAAAWLLGEGLRAWLFTGFPWNLIGSVWAFSAETLQAAAYGGVWLLSLITVAAAAAPAALTAPSGRRPAGRVAVLLLLLLPLASWALGVWRLDAAPAAGSAVVADVKLRLVQPSIPQELKWRADRKAANLRLQAELSRLPGHDSRTLIIWPETAVPYLLAAEPALQRDLAGLVPPGGFLIAGAPRVDPADPQGEIWNALHALDAEGGIVATYDKVHLVPFGEYTPLRSLLGLAKLTVGARDFSAGEGLKSLDLPGVPPFSPLICYEVIFPGAAKPAAADSAPRWLLNLTNDAWFGDSTGPYQHLAAAQMRAVEEGLPLVRAANNGISAVIDSYGRVLKRLELNDRGIIDIELPEAAAGTTPYSYAGNLLYWLELLITTCVIFVARRLI